MFPVSGPLLHHLEFRHARRQTDRNCHLFINRRHLRIFLRHRKTILAAIYISSIFPALPTRIRRNSLHLKARFVRLLCRGADRHRLSRCHRTSVFFIECPIIRAISPCFQHCHIVIIRSIGNGIDLRNRNQITTDRASRIIWCKMVKIVPDRLRIHLPAQLFIHNRENPLFQFFIKISLVHIPRDTAGYQREEIVLRVGISDVRRICILVII